MKPTKNPSIVALIHGQDNPGLVSRISSWIFLRGSNINHAEQHQDHEANVFFQRVEWTPSSGKAEEEGNGFEQFVRNELNMNVQVAYSSNRPKVAIFVSKFNHCLHDIILRFQSGELNGKLACIISNHENLRVDADRYGIPFYHIPVSQKSKSNAEAKQLELLRKHDIHLVLLARYMQVLSANFINEVNCPIINIHHSFLPAFAGGRPYHQAHARGVKLIGATAHYATAELDEGPIICQDVVHINHRNSVHDLILKGKDLEKMVFAQAIRLQLDNRILVYNNKTVVFD